MSDSIITNENTTEVSNEELLKGTLYNSPDNNSEEQSEGSTEVSTEENVEQPKTERPWNKKKEDQSIPYSRFKELVDEKNSLKAQIEELSRQREQNNTPETVVETKSKEPNPDDFSTVGEYITAVTKYESEQAVERYKAEQEKERTVREQQKYQAQILDSFNTKMEQAVKVNPEVADAVNFLSQNYSDKIRPDIEAHIFTDDNAPELLFEIATNEELLKEVTSKNANPFTLIRKLAKLSAKIDIEKAKSISVTETEDPDHKGTGVFKPSVNQKKEEIKKSIPKTFKGTVPNKKSVEDMSDDEYFKHRFG